MDEPALIVLVGTKAQFIKTAPILRELDIRCLPYRLVYTGQHSETFDLLEAAFGTRSPDDVLVPDFEAATNVSFLNWCMKYWWAVTQQIFKGRWKGARIGLVHGDTASTLFGAIAARLVGARVAHVEAGLRSPRLMEPFPEEIVRRLVSRLSTLHFVPDEHAAFNLRHARGQLVRTQGNTLRDALSMSLAMIGELPQQGGGGGYAIVSIHRSENLSRAPTFDLLMEEVLETATRLPVKFVLHPATRAKIHASGWHARLQRHPQLELLERMDYPDFVKLLVGSCFLLTDGGSNQEESALLGLPALLLRRATERNDGLGSNVVLSDLKRDAIREFVAQHRDCRWPLLLVEGASPTSILVDALQAELATPVGRP
jgi:UDP-N-acetylglucosamine 2-epimerase (non-hydrolysing)